MMSTRLVYTAITAGHAVLHDHPDNPDTDFVCFSDDPIAHQDLSSRWQLRPIEASSDLSPRRRAKFHKLFPPSEYEWTVWIDGSHRMSMESTGLVDDLVTASPSGFGLHKHPRMDCIYAEGQDVLTHPLLLSKRRDQPIAEQLQHYQRAGHPPLTGDQTSGRGSCTRTRTSRRSPTTGSFLRSSLARAVRRTSPASLDRASATRAYLPRARRAALVDRA